MKSIIALVVVLGLLLGQSATAELSASQISTLKNAASATKGAYQNKYGQGGSGGQGGLTVPSSNSLMSDLGMQSMSATNNGTQSGYQSQQQAKKTLSCRADTSANVLGLNIKVISCTGGVPTVQLCDAVTYGFVCYKDGAPTSRVSTHQLQGTQQFSGNGLTSSYTIKTTCAGGRCALDVTAKSGLKGGYTVENRQTTINNTANEYLGQDSMASNLLGMMQGKKMADMKADVKGQNYADCQQQRMNELWTTGKPHVTCDPQDTRTLTFHVDDRPGPNNGNPMCTDQTDGTCKQPVPINDYQVSTGKQSCHSAYSKNIRGCAISTELHGISIPTSQRHIAVSNVWSGQYTERTQNGGDGGGWSSYTYKWSVDMNKKGYNGIPYIQIDLKNNRYRVKFLYVSYISGRGDTYNMSTTGVSRWAKNGSLLSYNGGTTTKTRITWRAISKSRLAQACSNNKNDKIQLISSKKGVIATFSCANNWTVAIDGVTDTHHGVNDGYPSWPWYSAPDKRYIWPLGSLSFKPVMSTHKVDGCTSLAQNAPSSSDPKGCYLIQQKCVDSAPRTIGGVVYNPGCWRTERQYACYGDPLKSSCDSAVMSDAGWVKDATKLNPKYPTSISGQPNGLPVEWDNQWTYHGGVGTNAFGCAPTITTTTKTDATGGTVTTTHQWCYTGKTAECHPSPDPTYQRQTTCNVVSTSCAKTKHGLCVSQQQNYHCESTFVCMGSFGNSIGDTSAPRDNTAVLGKILATGEMADQLSHALQKGILGSDGQIRLFSGKADRAYSMTGGFKSVAKLATQLSPTGAVLTSFLNFDPDKGDCDTDNPDDVKTGANRGFCTEENVKTAAARMTKRAHQVGSQLKGDRSACYFIGGRSTYAPFFWPEHGGTLSQPFRMPNWCWENDASYAAHASDPYDGVPKAVQVDKFRTWCTFDSVFARIIQEQGRVQLNELSRLPATGAITQQKTYSFYANQDGGWTPSFKVNGNDVRFWQWNPKCAPGADAGYKGDAANTQNCPMATVTYAAVCSIPEKNGSADATKAAIEAQIKTLTDKITANQAAVQRETVARNAAQKKQAGASDSTLSPAQKALLERDQQAVTDAEATLAKDKKAGADTSTLDADQTAIDHAKETLDNDTSAVMKAVGGKAYYANQVSIHDNNIDAIETKTRLYQQQIREFNQQLNTSAVNGCGILPTNPALMGSGKWIVKRLKGDNNVLTAINRYVLAQGGCDATGQCQYAVSAWPATKGGQLNIPIDMAWMMNGPVSGWAHNTWNHNNFYIQAYTAPISLTPLLGSQPQTTTKPKIRYCLGSAIKCDPSKPTNWTTINPGNPTSGTGQVLMAADPSHDKPGVRLVGQCDASTGTCSYRAVIQIKVTAKPWSKGYTQKKKSWCMLKLPIVGCVHEVSVHYDRDWHPDCSGFTLDQFMALDLSKMDFSDAVGELKAEAQEKVENAMTGATDDMFNTSKLQASVDAMKTGTNAQAVPNSRATNNYLISDTDGYPGDTTTFTPTFADNTPQYEHIVNGKATSYSVSGVTIEWGDGTSSTTTPYQPVTHTYGSVDGDGHTTPATNKTYVAKVIWDTSGGKFTDQFTYNLWVNKAGAAKGGGDKPRFDGSGSGGALKTETPQQRYQDLDSDDQSLGGF